MMGLASSDCMFESGKRDKINSMAPELRKIPFGCGAPQDRAASMGIFAIEMSWSRKAKRLVASIGSDAMQAFRTK